MFQFSTLTLSILGTFACDGLDESFVTCTLVMIVHLSHHTFLQNPTLSPSFLVHPWQVCHARDNILFWLLTRSSFFISPM